MISYKNDEGLKKMLIKEIEHHKKLDQIVQGRYGKNEEGDDFKGCAVGCSIHSLNIKLGKNYSPDDHSVYESELGIPEWLARLEDAIFEGLPKNEAMKWPIQFAKAVPVGVNLEPIKWKFCAFIMKENIDRVLTLDISDDLKKQVVDAIRGVLVLHENAIKTGEWDESAAESAWSAAESAAESAWSAAESAWSAAESAWSAARSAARSAAESAWSAARSAAESAESAAESAWSAARSAARSAWSAARSAWSARSAAYKKYAKELLRLIEECK